MKINDVTVFYYLNIDALKKIVVCFQCDNFIGFFQGFWFYTGKDVENLGLRKLFIEFMWNLFEIPSPFVDLQFNGCERNDNEFNWQFDFDRMLLYLQ